MAAESGWAGNWKLTVSVAFVNYPRLRMGGSSGRSPQRRRECWTPEAPLFFGRRARRHPCRHVNFFPKPCSSKPLHQNLRTDARHALSSPSDSKDAARFANRQKKVENLTKDYNATRNPVVESDTCGIGKRPECSLDIVKQIIPGDNQGLPSHPPPRWDHGGSDATHQGRRLGWRFQR